MKTDNRASGTSHVSKSTSPLTDHVKLPLSPANYNVPQTTNLIYFRSPAGKIYSKTVPNLEGKTVGFDSHEANEISHTVDEVVPPTARRRRNSKLVRRYKSFAEVFS